MSDKRSSKGRLRAAFRAIRLALAALLLAAVAIPFVLPAPPAPDTRAAGELAFSDSAWATIDGVRIHYRVAGSDDASQTIVLLHGFGASTYTWREVTAPLARAGYRVVSFDRPAFGLSERPVADSFEPSESPYSMDANVAQTLGLLDHLGIDRAIVVGHSAGGAVAAMFAAAHPERVSALVLVAPAVYQARPIPAGVSALLRTPWARWYGPVVVRQIVGAGFDGFVASAYGDPAVATDEVVAGYRAPLSVEGWDRALWELVAAPRTESAESALSLVLAPTLVIAGTADTFVPFEDSERVARSISDATIVSFPGSGHLPHEEAPARFVGEVLDFLNQLNPR